MTQQADVHERVTEEAAARIGDLVYISLQPTSTWSEEVTLLARTNSGNLIWHRQQVAERPTGAVLSRAPWTIKDGSGTW